MKKKNAILLFTLFFLSFPIQIEAQETKHTNPTGMMVRLAKITVDASRLAAYNALLTEEIEASLSLEPGVILLYAVAEKENPNHITILEIYESREAYETHIQTPHFLKYKTDTEDMVQYLELTDTTPLLPHLLIKQK